MSNQDALIYIRRWLEVDQEAQQLRAKYVAVVSQVLTGKGTATLLQLDRRISMLMAYNSACRFRWCKARRNSAHPAGLKVLPSEAS